VFKWETKQFTIHELHLPESRFMEFDHTQIAGMENTVGKDKARKVQVSEIAVMELALFVFAGA
jgi:hypothetical protein